MPMYKITTRGASHYAKVRGRLVRFNADPRLGEPCIELDEDAAKSSRFAHLGLVPAPHAVVDRRVAELEVATPEAKTKPKDGGERSVTGTGADGDGGSSGPDAPDVDGDSVSVAPRAQSEGKLALPDGWQRLNKARKAGLVRKVSGQNAASWNVEQLDAWLKEYEAG